MEYTELIADLGREMGLELDGSGGACGFMADETEIILQDAGDMLLIRSDLGLIPEDAAGHLLNTLLDANYLYQGTGGSSFARNPADGHLHLQHYNWLERLDGKKLLALIEKFAGTCSRWSSILDDWEAREGDDPEARDSQIGDNGSSSMSKESTVSSGGTAGAGNAAPPAYDPFSSLAV